MAFDHSHVDSWDIGDATHNSCIIQTLRLRVLGVFRQMDLDYGQLLNEIWGVLML